MQALKRLCRGTSNVEYDDPINNGPDCGIVTDHQNRSAFDSGEELFKHFARTVDVKMCGRLIEEKDAPRAEKHPSEAEALALSGAHWPPRGSEPRLETVGQPGEPLAEPDAGEGRLTRSF
jgi:hypothetical protein